MTPLRNDYASTLMEKRVLYVPSCTIVEMMSRLYGEVAAINASGNMASVAPDLLILLRRMQFNLRVTAEAYEESRIGFFIGDWREDKLRARKLFFNIMSRLGYVSELLERMERNMLFAATEALTAEWTALDRLMDAKAEERRARDEMGVCGGFRSCGSESWRRSMAEVLLSVDSSPGRDAADYLLLLCYGTLKDRLVAAVREAERRAGSPALFDPGRIFVVSREGGPSCCVKCAEAECRESSRRLISGRTTRRSVISLKKPSSATAAHFQRRAAPPSLCSPSPGKR